MIFNEYSEDGRTLMVMFTCKRCGIEFIDTLESHKDDDEGHFDFLHRIKPPPGWGTVGYGDLLCPDCARKYKKFMNGG